MKTKFDITFLLLAMLSFAGCKKMEYCSEFERSHQIWMGFKKEWSDTYRYTVQSGSWVGTSSETTITVKSGKVVQRDYTYSEPIRNSTASKVVVQWTEEESELGSHTDSPAAKPVTLDQVYDLAREDLLKKRKGATTYFEARNNGMISSAGYTDDGCMDDCFNGITIVKIERL